MATPKTHLCASGRIHSSSGAVNGPGNRVDGARLVDYDSEKKTVLVRVDHSTVPEFWLEVVLPLAQLERFVEHCRREEEEEEGQDENGDEGSC